MIPFDVLYQSRLKSGISPASERLLCFDPGGTTGAALFHGIQFVQGIQLNTSQPESALAEITLAVDDTNPTMVVMEDYKVYGHRQEQHVGSSLQTPRLIGMIEALLYQRGIPFHKQMAHLAKGFVTNAHLRAWGMWSVSAKHALDATRHGCYFLLYPPKVVVSKEITYTRKTLGRRVG